MWMAVAIFVFSLHRCWGPCSSENSGGRYSLQWFTDVAQWHTNSLLCLFSSLTVNTLLINSDCLSPELLVLLFVFPAERRVRFTSLIYSLLALISGLHTTLPLSLVFCPPRLVLRRLRHNAEGTLYCLTCCFHKRLCEFVSEEVSAVAFFCCQSATTCWWNELSYQCLFPLLSV